MTYSASSGLILCIPCMRLLRNDCLKSLRMSYTFCENSNMTFSFATWSSVESLLTITEFGASRKMSAMAFSSEPAFLRSFETLLSSDVMIFCPFLNNQRTKIYLSCMNTIAYFYSFVNHIFVSFHATLKPHERCSTRVFPILRSTLFEQFVFLLFLRVVPGRRIVRMDLHRCSRLSYLARKWYAFCRDRWFVLLLSWCDSSFLFGYFPIAMIEQNNILVSVLADRYSIFRNDVCDSYTAIEWMPFLVDDLLVFSVFLLELVPCNENGQNLQSCLLVSSIFRKDTHPVLTGEVGELDNFVGCFSSEIFHDTYFPFLANQFPCSIFTEIHAFFSVNTDGHSVKCNNISHPSILVEKTVVVHDRLNTFPIWKFFPLDNKSDNLQSSFSVELLQVFETLCLIHGSGTNSMETEQVKGFYGLHVLNYLSYLRPLFSISISNTRTTVSWPNVSRSLRCANACSGVDHLRLRNVYLAQNSIHTLLANSSLVDLRAFIISTWSWSGGTASNFSTTSFLTIGSMFADASGKSCSHMLTLRPISGHDWLTISCALFCSSEMFFLLLIFLKYLSCLTVLYVSCKSIITYFYKFVKQYSTGFTGFGKTRLVQAQVGNDLVAKGGTTELFQFAIDAQTFGIHGKALKFTARSEDAGYIGNGIAMAPCIENGRIDGFPGKRQTFNELLFHDCIVPFCNISITLTACFLGMYIIALRASSVLKLLRMLVYTRLAFNSSIRRSASSEETWSIRHILETLLVNGTSSNRFTRYPQSLLARSLSSVCSVSRSIFAFLLKVKLKNFSVIFCCSVFSMTSSPLSFYSPDIILDMDNVVMLCHTVDLSEHDSSLFSDGENMLSCIAFSIYRINNDLLSSIIGIVLMAFQDDSEYSQTHFIHTGQPLDQFLLWQVPVFHNHASNDLCFACQVLWNVWIIVGHSRFPFSLQRGEVPHLPRHIIKYRIPRCHLRTVQRLQRIFLQARFPDRMVLFRQFWHFHTDDHDSFPRFEKLLHCLDRWYDAYREWSDVAWFLTWSWFLSGRLSVKLNTEKICNYVTIIEIGTTLVHSPQVGSLFAFRVIHEEVVVGQLDSMIDSGLFTHLVMLLGKSTGLFIGHGCWCDHGVIPFFYLTVFVFLVTSSIAYFTIIVKQIFMKYAGAKKSFYFTPKRRNITVWNPFQFFRRKEKRLLNVSMISWENVGCTFCISTSMEIRLRTFTLSSSGIISLSKYGATSAASIGSVFSSFSRSFAIVAYDSASQMQEISSASGLEFCERSMIFFFLGNQSPYTAIHMENVLVLKLTDLRISIYSNIRNSGTNRVQTSMNTLNNLDFLICPRLSIEQQVEYLIGFINSHSVLVLHDFCCSFGNFLLFRKWQDSFLNHGFLLLPDFPVVVSNMHNIVVFSTKITLSGSWIIQMCYSTNLVDQNVVEEEFSVGSEYYLANTAMVKRILNSKSKIPVTKNQCSKPDNLIGIGKWRNHFQHFANFFCGDHDYFLKLDDFPVTSTDMDNRIRNVESMNRTVRNTCSIRTDVIDQKPIFGWFLEQSSVLRNHLTDHTNQQLFSNLYNKFRLTKRDLVEYSLSITLCEENYCFQQFPDLETLYRHTSSPLDGLPATWCPTDNGNFYGSGEEEYPNSLAVSTYRYFFHRIMGIQSGTDHNGLVYKCVDRLWLDRKSTRL